jgi:hypothetical protein
VTLAYGWRQNWKPVRKAQISPGREFTSGVCHDALEVVVNAFFGSSPEITIKYVCTDCAWAYYIENPRSVV